MPVTNNTILSESKSIRTMFDAIAPTYDLLNHLMSFGLDIRWRKQAVSILQEIKGGIFLDIAAGSGDITLELLKLRPKQIITSDFSLNMMSIFQQKLAKLSPTMPITLLSCNAQSLPFNDASFDGTIVAFGIRNFTDRLQALREMVRVLKPGGLSVVLELTQPTRPLISQLYAVHTRVVLPFIGKIISKHNSAYQYLPKSIGSFPTNDKFLTLMEKAGFQESRARLLSFGVATIFVGRKLLIV